MSPPLMNQYTSGSTRIHSRVDMGQPNGALARYPTPDDLGSEGDAFGLPLISEQQLCNTGRDSSSDGPSSPEITRARPAQNGRIKSTSAGTKPCPAFRFHMITHPDDLRNKKEMQKNRQHVMRNFLDTERQNPDSTDPRVAECSHREKRKRPEPHAPAALVSRNESQRAQSVGSDTLPATPNSLAQNTSASRVSPEWENNTAITIERREKAEANQKALLANVRSAIGKIQDRPLVRSPERPYRYLNTDVNAVPMARFQIGRDSNPYGSLNPLHSWPAFADPTVDVNELKFNCAHKFGTQSLAIHWVPLLLQARHAFLSTTCISSAHDDIMMRAVHSAAMNATPGSELRDKVRDEVISMIQDSMNDPQQATADTTIAAVLQLLNSEIMGCDDHTMGIHQHGLHTMVVNRGGLEALGVDGYLASVLTITMYLIAVLRETVPHQDFVRYAARRPIRTPSTNAKLPESPVYCRPLSGYQTIARAFAFEPTHPIYQILETLRRLTNCFFIDHANDFSCIPHPQLRYLRGVQEEELQRHIPCTISSLRDELFSLPLASDVDGFKTMSDRYIYESLRLVALIYAHALAHRIPISQAALALTRSLATDSHNRPPRLPSDTPPDTPIHIVLRNTLMKTDFSDCWGQLSGVLFWLTIVGGAASNPGTLANSERRGAKEDARTWLAAITVRCSIVLSFEFGSVVLESLIRIIAIERVLAMGSASADRLQLTTASTATPPERHWSGHPAGAFCGSVASSTGTRRSNSLASSWTSDPVVWPGGSSDGGYNSRERGLIREGPEMSAAPPVSTSSHMLGFADYVLEFWGR